MDELKEAVSRLPESPGVYRFYNTEDELIYVGKAKSIKTSRKALVLTEKRLSLYRRSGV
jgi:excinuclease ABC subunit C